MSDSPQRILFLCSMNRLRSPTAEEVFSGVPGLEVRSAGLDKDARCRCEPDDLRWADLVLVMERRHRGLISRQFGEVFCGRKAVVLGIPDEYACMQPELVLLLLAKVPQFLRVPVDVDAIKARLGLVTPAMPALSFSPFW